MVNFPTPIGGNITDDDIVPCTIFLALHVLLLPAIAWNYFKRDQWNIVAIGGAIYAVERVALYSLRCRQAYDVTSRTSNVLLFYQQAVLGYGFTGLIIDYFSMYRCLVVETTLPDAGAGGPNLARRRFWFRRFTDVFAFSLIPASVVGVIANTRYAKAIEDQSEADRLWYMRLGTIIATFVLHQIAIASVTYGLFKVPRIRRRPCIYILSMLLLLEILFIYRIAILPYTETSLTATGPGTLTSKGAKAAFYLLQSTIELCVMAFLLLSPMRQLYGVGRWGDRPDDHQMERRQEGEEEQLASTTRLTSK